MAGLDEYIMPALLLDYRALVFKGESVLSQHPLHKLLNLCNSSTFFVLFWGGAWGGKLVTKFNKNEDSNSKSIYTLGNRHEELIT